MGHARARWGPLRTTMTRGASPYPRYRGAARFKPLLREGEELRIVIDAEVAGHGLYEMHIQVWTRGIAPIVLADQPTPTVRPTPELDERVTAADRDGCLARIQAILEERRAASLGKPPVSDPE